METLDRFGSLGWDVQPYSVRLSQDWRIGAHCIAIFRHEILSFCVILRSALFKVRNWSIFSSLLF